MCVGLTRVFHVWGGTSACPYQLHPLFVAARCMHCASFKGLFEPSVFFSCFSWVTATIIASVADLREIGIPWWKPVVRFAHYGAEFCSTPSRLSWFPRSDRPLQICFSEMHRDPYGDLRRASSLETWVEVFEPFSVVFDWLKISEISFWK